MENETRFDLNHALDAWKEGLASVPEISAEDVRELETHLRECFEAERQRGLTERDAFLLAVQKIGPPEHVGAEFAKLNPLRSWPHRVALMAFAGLLVWVWSSVTSALSVALQVFWSPPAAAYVVLTILLGAVLPLAVLALVVNRCAKRLLRGVALLFSNRWLFLLCLLVFAVLLNYADAWSVWNNPNPEKIFGPGGREQTSFGSLFWQYCSHLPSWPGPLVALLVWLAPCARRTFAAAGSQHGSGVRITRELVFWLSLGSVVISCVGALANATLPLFSRMAFWLYPDSETPFRVLTTVLRWMPNVILCALAIIAARGKIGFLTERAAVWLDTRVKVAAAGLILISVSHGALAVSFSVSPSTLLLWLLFYCFWPVTFLGVITWLTPSTTTRSTA